MTGILFFLEVSADQTKTALIAAGCVAGGLLISAAAIGAILCFIRQKRRVEKQPLPRYHDGVTMTNGIYRPERFIRRSSTFSGTSVNSQHSDIRDERRSLRAKTFTQNAQSPRQRPPVLFYTIRADPRLYPELQMGLPIYSRPPQVGRPVFFLDRTGNSKSKRNNEDFMYRNSGTMLYLANGGAGMTTGTTAEERASRQPSRETRKDRPRSQSFSRSRRLEIFTRRHSDTSETSLIGAPGDVILRQKVDNIKVHSKAGNQNRQDDNNNNQNIFKAHSTSNVAEMPVVNFVKSASNIKGYANNNKHLPGERYSATQLHANNIVYPAMNKPPSASHFLYKERGGTIDFGDDDDSLTSTPRKDYPNDTPRISEISQLSKLELTERRSAVNHFPLAVTDPEGTPRADYGPEATAQIDYSESFQIKAGEIEDIIALAEQPTKYYKGERENGKVDMEIVNHRQNANLDRPPSPPSLARPASPPFDGGELVMPSRMSAASLGERSNTDESRSPQPTPPPPDTAYPSLDLQSSPPPPPPPPPPPLSARNGKHRPLTPRPEMIKYDDISGADEPPNTVRKLSTGKEFPPPKTSTDSQPKLAQLPFMEELKRRQRSIDEGVSWLPPSSATASTPPQGSSFFNNLRRNSGKDNPSNNSDDDSSRSESSRANLPQRPSVVQFADDPPEIIPPEDQYSFPIYEDGGSERDVGTNSFLSSPPPPPPPLQF
ncbi:hypothetical protein BsWGS_20957 [Bradybaena similaris]